MNTTINSTIVLGTQSAVRLPPKARDTRVLTIMLLLRRLCDKKLAIENVPMHVVGENQEDMTAKLALGPRQRGQIGVQNALKYREPDFVNTQAINARVLTQTLAYPIIRGAIADLFDESRSSADIELVMAQNFIPLGIELSIGVVREMVLQTQGERSIFVSIYSRPLPFVTIAPWQHHCISSPFEPCHDLRVISTYHD